MNSPVSGEFFGTVVLILFGSGVGCSVNLKGTLAKGRLVLAGYTLQWAGRTRGYAGCFS